MTATLKALKIFSKKNSFDIVVIYPNTDPGSLRMIEEINKYKNYKNFFVFKNLPHNEFVNIIRMSSALVGNSSMGLGRLLQNTCYKCGKKTNRKIECWKCCFCKL